jgi:Spy/CpxP family protein refolding chaperone
MTRTRMQWLQWLAVMMYAAVIAAPLTAQGGQPGGGRPAMGDHHPGPGGPGRPGGPGGPAMGEDPLAHHMYAPQLVMQHQSELGLTDAQRTTIMNAMKDAQSAVVETQWKLSAETEKLGNLLHVDRVDETAALAQVDRILTLERDMKRAQMTLMIRIKNALTTAQQQKLQQLHHPDGEPGDGEGDRDPQG